MDFLSSTVAEFPSESIPVLIIGGLPVCSIRYGSRGPGFTDLSISVDVPLMVDHLVGFMKARQQLMRLGDDL